jgi:ribosome-binding factor A
MSSRRLLKAAEAIREVVSMAILTEMRDPRVQDVTVIGVEVAPDMRSAKVLVSIMGPESKQQLALRGLDNAKGFLQARIAERIDTRYTPKLQFVADQGVKKSLEVGKILEQLAAERQAAEQGLAVSVDESELETQPAVGAIKQFAPDTDDEADLDEESDFEDDDELDEDEFDEDELEDEVFEDDDQDDDDSDLDDDDEDDDVDETEVDDEYSDDESDK